MRFQQSSDSVARSLSFSMMISISRSLIHATCPWRSLFSSNERNLQQVDLSGPGSDTKSLDFFLRSAVWTGSEMIVWGGAAPSPSLTGGRYNPSTDSWTATSTATAPPARVFHTAVWTGIEMVVWGGCANDNCSQLSVFGGRYNPQTDSWIFTSNTNAPSPRYDHTAVWSGSEMIVWGGFDGSNRVNTGGRYNTGTDSWTATSTTNAPSARRLW